MVDDPARAALPSGTTPSSPPQQPSPRQGLSDAPAVGEIIAAKYRVERVLGAGGMGVVVAARHLQLDVKVAIKFLLRSSLESPEAVQRFAREARAAAAVPNEHIARVLDVGALDNGAPYIVMEFLDGSDLATRLQSHGPMPIEEAVECVLQACEALADIHALGIVHRDLKPANLFWIHRGSGLPWIKVLDFGISKVRSIGASSRSSRDDMTQSAALMGSPLYMSPEQMQSARAVDARSDIWSLGVVLFELIAGSRPFDGETLPEVCVNISVRRPVSVREVRPDCPERLEAVITHCLEKDPSDRYSDVAAFALALLPFGPDRSRASVERITRTAEGALRPAPAGGPGLNAPGSDDVAPHFLQTLTALGKTAGGPGARRRSVLLAAGAATSLAVGVALTTALLSHGGTKPAAEIPSTAAAGQPSGLLAPPQTLPARPPSTNPELPDAGATAASASPVAHVRPDRLSPAIDAQERPRPFQASPPPTKTPSPKTLNQREDDVF